MTVPFLFGCLVTTPETYHQAGIGGGPSLKDPRSGGQPHVVLHHGILDTKTRLMVQLAPMIAT
jgi:hypothetical protein